MTEPSSIQNTWQLSYEPPDQASLEAFLKAASQSNDTILFPVFLLLSETGMTVEEILGLSFRDCTGSGQIVQNEEATSRFIQLKPATQKVLDQWIQGKRAAWIQEKKQQKMPIGNASQKIFPISRAYLRCAMNELMRDAGVQPFVLSVLESEE